MVIGESYCKEGNSIGNLYLEKGGGTILLTVDASVDDVRKSDIEANGKVKVGYAGVARDSVTGEILFYAWYRLITTEGSQKNTNVAEAEGIWTLMNLCLSNGLGPCHVVVLNDCNNSVSMTKRIDERITPDFWAPCEEIKKSQMLFKTPPLITRCPTSLKNSVDRLSKFGRLGLDLKLEEFRDCLNEEKECFPVVEEEWMKLEMKLQRQQGNLFRPSMSIDLGRPKVNSKRMKNKNLKKKVAEVSTSKTSKHDYSKRHFVATHIFNGNKLDDIVPSSHDCDVAEVSTSVSTSKTGKHDHSKHHFATDIFNGKKLEDVVPSSHTCDVSLLTDSGDTKDDLKLPNDDALVKQMKEGFEAGKD